MPHKRSIKYKAYYKRYQVKFQRRRIGKTDYRARKRLCAQSKNKYNTPKYRYCVRFTRHDIVCQIIYATLAGDIVMAAAYSHELPRYGMKAGLTNYAAAYATGLLLARRTLKKLGMDETYEGCTEVDGEDYTVEADGDARPFRANLDVGLTKTSIGNRVFGALKGALDGGLNIPHNVKRFAGYDADAKELDAEVHKKYIFGGHVAEYAEMLHEEEPERYEEQFAKYLAADMVPEDLEEVMEGVHEAIREDPEPEKSEKNKPDKPTRWKQVKLSYEEKKANLKEKLEALKSMDDDDSDED
jgi:large subunit ribosomal protein L5e